MEGRAMSDIFAAIDAMGDLYVFVVILAVAALALALLILRRA
jgi:hypothetical protein